MGRALAVLVLGAGGADAQADPNRDARCVEAADAIRPRFPTGMVGAVGDCGELAFALNTVVFAEIAGAAARAESAEVDDFLIDARDVQPRRGQTAGTAGSVAQAEATASANPVPLAGGSVALVGTEGGSASIAALSLNPSFLFLDADEGLEAARWERLLDVTLLVPAATIESPEEADLDYLGLRVRLDADALTLGGAAELEAQLQAGLDRVSAQLDDRQDFVEALLGRVEEGEVEACAEALARFDAKGGSLAEITRACRTTEAEATPYLDPSPERTLRSALDKTLDAVDRHYVGLDLRLDLGDPTLGAVPEAGGRRAFAGLAAGMRVPTSRRRAGALEVGLRGRVGALYADLDSLDEAKFAVEGGAGVEFARAYGLQLLTLQAGFDFRSGGAVLDSELAGGGDADEVLPTDYWQFRLQLNVPIGNTNSVSISYATRLDVGEPVLSVNGNWQIPWPSEPGGIPDRE